MKTNSWRALALGIVTGLGVALSACSGGGGGGGSDSTSAQVKACETVAGPTDAMQTALTTLGTKLAAVPTVGVQLEGLVFSVISLTEGLDSIANSLTALNGSADPQAFASVVANLGPSVNCAAGQAQSALAGLLNGGALNGTPAAGLIQPILGQLADIQDLIGAGGAPSADQLVALIAKLQDLSSALNGLTGKLPIGTNLPLLQNLTQALASSSVGLAQILMGVTSLDAGATSAAFTQTLMTVGLVFASGNLTGVAALDNVIRPAAAQVMGASLPVVQTLTTTLYKILSPLFSALQKVLAPVGGADVLGSILGGVMTGNTGAVQGLLQKLLGGGVVGGTNVPLLSTLLGLV